MYCLCHFLPFLFIPTTASSYFLMVFLVSLSFLHRPCIYCSLILITLFSTTCYWQENCFLDFNNRQFFQPRFLTTETMHTLGFTKLAWLKEILKRREWYQPLVGITIRL
ncbi:hypothetical protein PORY_002230 [Pneumocystis oryctolagi]|uniref:Uncharacterized protein n=1 Tax=Pneumocystis oryctolagi TaxID=42067 RepID=A0ACB7CAL7_9ASCO|nr:hypothetical protein PORY_002230 [Pneumocystis oryctolagi]